MNQELFYKKLTDIKVLYDKVNHAIILSENFDPKQEYYVASANELRKVL